MRYLELRNCIKDLSEYENFQSASDRIQEVIFNLSKKELIPLTLEIGTIPEDIAHDSTEEKLYTKTSDIILAKCFMELGLKASVIRERSNCADIIAKSDIHGYSLIGDAKAFRLSRTAKNQKDFKVESMIHWRKDNDSDYSVLCCPYFQYPKKNSQIYSSAINGNVALFSWEYFTLLLKEDITETPRFNLSKLWSFSEQLYETVMIKNQNNCFIPQQDVYIKQLLSLADKNFDEFFNYVKNNIMYRCDNEIEYFENKILEIKEYSKEDAINMLIKSLKLNEKIDYIKKYKNTFMELKCK